MLYNEVERKEEEMNEEKLLSKIAGENLKQVIKAKYLSQGDFAFDFGVEMRTLSRWLNNGITNIDTLQQITEFLQIEITDLFVKKH